MATDEIQLPKLEQILQTVKRAIIRGPVFEVLRNKAGEWFVHERSSNGQIKNMTETYATRWNATRAAKKKAAETRFASWRVVPPEGRASDA